MTPLETTLTILIAIVLVVLAVFFAIRQHATLRALHFDTKLPALQRRYLARQVGRRLFGSLLLLLLAALLVGSIFLDYDRIQVRAADDARPAEAIQTFRVISFYWMMTLLVLMVTIFLAVIDLWATTRFAFQQQKQLVLEHQHALEAELARYRNSQ